MVDTLDDTGATKFIIVFVTVCSFDVVYIS